MDDLGQTAPVDQPQVFSQPVVVPPDPAPPAPAPAPAPAQESEAPPVEPTWLSGAPEPMYQPPQVPPHYYEPPPQQYYEPPPQRPPIRKGSLESFVDNPDEYISQVLEQRLSAVQGPLAYQQQMIAASLNQMRNVYTTSAIRQAETALRDAYKEFNKDSAFRSNKRLQQRVENTLRGLMGQAVQAAQAGNYEPLTNLSGMNAAHVRATLAAAKALDGIGSPGVGPLQVEGAYVESARPATQGRTVELTLEQQEIARRLGPGSEDRLRAAIAETAKYNDFEG